MKSTTRAFVFLVLAATVSIAIVRAEEDCNPNGKSYGAKTVTCGGGKKTDCADSSVETSLAGVMSCVPNFQIIAIYGADIACQELSNVTGTKKVCIDFYSYYSETNAFEPVTEACYDSENCVPTPYTVAYVTLYWYCTSGLVLTQNDVQIKCTADCRDANPPSGED